MAVDCIVVSGSTIFGYTHYEKTDPEETQKHIKNILSETALPDLQSAFSENIKPFWPVQKAWITLPLLKKQIHPRRTEKSAAYF